MPRLKIYNNATGPWEYVSGSGKAFPVGDVVGTSDTQTLTNKTLTSPVISGAGATTAGTYGYDATDHAILIGNGTTNSPIHIGHWKAWTPTWTNLTKGSATITAFYAQIGKTVHYRISLTFAADTSISGSVLFTLPVTSISYSGTYPLIGTLAIADIGINAYFGIVKWNSTTTGLLWNYTVYGTLISPGAFSATTPMTWTTGDGFNITGTYEAA